jgi:hypothetical protein
MNVPPTTEEHETADNNTSEQSPYPVRTVENRPFLLFYQGKVVLAYCITLNTGADPCRQQPQRDAVCLGAAITVICTVGHHPLPHDESFPPSENRDTVRNCNSRLTGIIM